MRPEQTAEELVEQLMSQCPYDAHTEPNLWRMYNLGLLKTIVARWARDDWLLKQELKQRTEK